MERTTFPTSKRMKRRVVLTGCLALVLLASIGIAIALIASKPGSWFEQNRFQERLSEQPGFLEHSAVWDRITTTAVETCGSSGPSRVELKALEDCMSTGNVSELAMRALSRWEDRVKGLSTIPSDGILVFPVAFHDGVIKTIAPPWVGLEYIHRLQMCRLEALHLPEGEADEIARSHLRLGKVLMTANDVLMATVGLRMQKGVLSWIDDHALPLDRYAAERPEPIAGWLQRMRHDVEHRASMMLDQLGCFPCDRERVRRSLVRSFELVEIHVKRSDMEAVDGMIRTYENLARPPKPFWVAIPQAIPAAENLAAFGYWLSVPVERYIDARLQFLEARPDWAR